MFRLADEWNIRVQNGYVSLPPGRLFSADGKGDLPYLDFLEKVVHQFCPPTYLPSLLNFHGSWQSIWYSMRDTAVKALQEAPHLRLQDPTPWYMMPHMPCILPHPCQKVKWRKEQPPRPQPDMPS